MSMSDPEGVVAYRGSVLEGFCPTLSLEWGYDLGVMFAILN